MSWGSKSLSQRTQGFTVYLWPEVGMMFSASIDQKTSLRTLLVSTMGSRGQRPTPHFYEYFPQVDTRAIVFINLFNIWKQQTKAPARLEPSAGAVPPAQWPREHLHEGPGALPSSDLEGGRLTTLMERSQQGNLDFGLTASSIHPGAN